MGRIQRHQTQQPSNQPGRRQRQHPPTEDKAQLPPVHRSQIIIHQRHPSSRTRQALGRRHGQPQPGRQQHRDGRAQLRRKPSGRRHLRDLVTQRPHDIIPVEPEPQTQQQARNHKEPHRRRRLGIYRASTVRRIHGGPRPHRIRHVVAPVRNRHHHGRDHLAVGPEVLDAVVVAARARVDVAQQGGVVRDHVAGDALQEAELDPAEPFPGVCPGEVGDRVEEAFVRAEVFLAGFELRGGLGGVGCAFDVVSGLEEFGVGGLGLLRLLLGGVEVGFRAGEDFAVGVFVVVCDEFVALAGEVERAGILEKPGAEGEVVDADAGVLLDEAAVEVGEEEDDADEEAAEEDAQDDADGFAGAEFLEGGGGGGFDADEEGEDGAGRGEVDGDETHGPLEGILALEDAVLQDAEDEGREAGCNGRGNPPGCGDLGDTALGPFPVNGCLSGEADTDQSTDNRLSGRDRPAHPGCQHQPGSIAHFGAAHCQHQRAGLVLKPVDADDAGLDGIGHAGSEGNRPNELGTHGQDADLPHAQRARSDGRGVRVGHIVSSVTKGTEDEGDGGEGEDPVVLGGCGWDHLEVKLHQQPW